jgi:2-polyprenyl-3-methyl-5-hydroxy-6-metoxy-1,4-benzoquinol methylase
MANAKGKEIDNTCLSLDQAAKRLYLHRDFQSHVFRWSHVAKWFNQSKRFQTAHILDVACGREMPLPRMLYTMKYSHTTGSYTGVDYNKLERHETFPAKTDKFNMKLIGGSDFLTVELPRKSYDVLINFEMLEHIEPLHAFKMMQRMCSLLAKGGHAFISTPCYDEHVGAADSHVNEMSYSAFKALLQMAGFKIEKHWGTFASQTHYKKLMTPAQAEVFEALNEYYDSNVISNIMAPMFPAQSRNCIWYLSPGKVVAPDKDEIKELSKPHNGSSTKWSAEFKKIVKLVGA